MQEKSYRKNPVIGCSDKRKETCWMLQKIKFHCGHTQIMDLTGQTEERAKKSEWYEKNITCPECRMRMALQEERYAGVRRES